MMPKNALQAAADQYWFSHGRFVAAEGDQRIACAQAFLAGARCSMHETARLSPYVNQFLEMVVLLGGPDDSMEAGGNATGSTGESDSATSGCEKPPDC